MSPTFIGQLPNWRPTSAAAAALTGVTQRRRAVGQTSGQTGGPGQAAAWQRDGRMMQLEINNNVVKSKLNWTLLAAAAVVFSKQGRC